MKEVIITKYGAPSVLQVREKRNPNHGKVRFWFAIILLVLTFRKLWHGCACIPVPQNPQQL